MKTKSAAHKGTCDVWREIREKLEHRLGVFSLQFSTRDQWCVSGVTTGPDSTPSLRACVCLCVFARVSACVRVRWSVERPRLASLHKQRSPETGKVTFLSNDWRDLTPDCTVCTCPAR